MQDIFIPFIAVALAEIFDKSQLSLILLASKTKRHLPLLLGALVAFLLVDGVAIAVGAQIRSFIPQHIINMFAGGIFVLFGIIALRKPKTSDSAKISVSKQPFLSAFTTIFLAEWGDKTQLASMGFAATRNPLLVLIGVMLAMLLLSLIALYAGGYIGKTLKKDVLNKITGVLFILIGLTILLGYSI